MTDASVVALFSPGRQRRQPQLNCGVAILVRDSLGLARWTAGLQEPATQFSDDGIVPGPLVGPVGRRSNCGGQWILVLESGTQ